MAPDQISYLPSTTSHSLSHTTLPRTFAPRASESVLVLTTSSASSISSMPTAENSGISRSASRRIPCGSSVRNAAMPAFVFGAAAAAFLTALGAALGLAGNAASSAASSAALSAFLAAASAFLAASISVFDAPLPIVSQNGYGSSTHCPPSTSPLPLPA